MTKLKTIPTDASVSDYLNAVKDGQVRQDCQVILDIMQEATHARPQMWGDSIVGFGTYHYCYGSGREGDWMLTGFSARKQNITLYIMSGFDMYQELLARLGKHSLGKSCLYIKKLADVNLPTLKKLIQASVDHLAQSNNAK